MDDKRLESQKTVVAFVAGLLIGGLLVWVFSESPAQPTPPTEDANPEVTEETNGENEEAETPTPSSPTSTETSSTPNAPAPQEEITGDFSFNVQNQPAGTSVSLGDAKYPTKEGWIVVHEDANGELGNALGAARYDTAVGLAPKNVTLLRATQQGGTYHVVYYSENGDRMFDIREDTAITADGEAIETTFTAQ